MGNKLNSKARIIMKQFTLIFILVLTNACASESNLSRQGANMDSVAFQKKLTISLNGVDTKLELYNMNYVSIDKMCLAQKIKQFTTLMENGNYATWKHFPHWATPFQPGKKPWTEKMILVHSNIQGYILFIIANKPIFNKLPKAPLLMSSEDRFRYGWAEEEIDFLSCFK